MSISLKNISADGKNIRKFYVHKSYDIVPSTAAAYNLRISAGVSGLSGSYVRAETFDLFGPSNPDSTYQFSLFTSMHQKYYASHSTEAPEYPGQKKVLWYTESQSLSSSIISGRGVVDSTASISVPSVNRITVVSIPRSAFGDAVMPSSLVMTDNSSSKTIVDDGCGNLKFKYPDAGNFPSGYTFNLTLGGITTTYSTSSIIGNVFYEHGIALLITGSAGYLLYGDESANSGSAYDISFKNSVPIYEHEYMCNVNAGEFGTTQNPTAVNYNSSGLPMSLQSFVTHSQFMPYITTIGLYNDDGDLVAISKFSKPIKKIPYLDYTFIVRFDS
jgi:hypothetical protein